ncbi:sphingomyelin phosphodiesterase 1-like [Wyeomyia smithii]|uniref:sphingomyelin phosphodiesterase 1-like n=1 Tax=Wyeomyia smithii TaxID=174621 RepID=UPI002467D4BC|nr:sphingomyelin phosphodiesterase 1-like [Wyeomyia smithii]
MKLTIAVWINVLLVVTMDGYQVKPRDFQQMVSSMEQQYEDIQEEFQKEFRTWQQTGEKTVRLQQILDGWKFTGQDRREYLEDFPHERQTAMCVLCRSVVSQIMQMRSNGTGRADLFATVYELCTTLQIQESDVCFGVIDINIDIVLHIFDERPNLGADVVCGVILQSSSCVFDAPEFTDWSVNVDPNGKPVTESKHFPNARSENDIKIVQITDMHYDPKYEAGYNANCNKPTCCRNDQGIPEDPEDGAGYWGDLRYCDSSWASIEDAIDHIVEEHPDAAYIYQTGDIVDHGVWETSFGHNIRTMNRFHNKLLEAFPDKPVYNTIGNHEPHPLNVFAPSTVSRQDLSVSWLYEYLADVWGHWLPRSTRTSILQGGFYTALVRPGLRVVVLNNQDCYNMNWWIMWDPGYLATQLQWLHDVLLLAERNGEKVHLLAHIPYSSYGSIYFVCQREFRRIVERFHDTISAQFNGHTHKDEINVFYSRENPQHAINVAWNGGSLTSSHNNLNYVVYYVDPETYQVTDFESYIFNLTDANRFPDRRPEWYKVYSFADAFGMHNLSPAEVDTVVKRFGTPAGRSELRKYWEFTMKMGDLTLAAGCDDDCLLNVLCRAVLSELNDDVKCDELRETFFD